MAFVGAEGAGIAGAGGAGVGSLALGLGFMKLDSSSSDAAGRVGTTGGAGTAGTGGAATGAGSLALGLGLMKSRSSSSNNAEERLGAVEDSLALGFMKSRSSSSNNAEERLGAVAGSLALGLELNISKSSSPKRSDMRFAGAGADAGTGGGALVGIGGGGREVEALRIDLSSETLSNRLSSFPESKSSEKALLLAEEAEDFGLLILFAKAKSDSRSPNKLAVDWRIDSAIDFCYWRKCKQVVNIETLRA
jgi:hypothetical protein